MAHFYLDLLLYLLVYSFLGWVTEVCVVAVKEHRLCNRGFFNLPFCFSYGIIMELLILILPTIHGMTGQYIFQFAAVLAVSSVVTWLSGSLAKRLSRNLLWHYEENNLFTGNGRQVVAALARAAVYLLVLLLVHPLLVMLAGIMPRLLKLVICAVIGVLLILDFLSIVYAIYRDQRRVKLELLEETQSRLQKSKAGLGSLVYRMIWKRLERAYPSMEHMPVGGKVKETFAPGLCWDKLVWIFFITALLGDLIETVFCRFSMGYWMSRSSLIYGPFSVVWGLGAIILTVVLQRLADKEDRYIFLSGCLLGGVYEYGCSVILEVVFGKIFWDYSHIPLNIGGRVNLLFCLFWGALAVIWVKVLYPRLSGLIEKIPPIIGKIITWFIVIFFLCDGILSAAVIFRYNQRAEDAAGNSVVGQFLDENYTDDFVEFVWPSMKPAE